jgi:uncharacterized membrane protein YcaP (DUF421 family)
MISFNEILGLNASELNEYQMVARAFVIFFVSLIFIRVSGLRTFGKYTTFDNITSIMLGAIMGRAIVTNQSLLGSFLATLLIMLLHRILAWISFKSKEAGKIIKNEKIILMKDGRKNLENMSKVHISDEDILEAARQDANISSMKEIKEAHLERSGYISIVKKEE